MGTNGTVKEHTPFFTDTYTSELECHLRASKMFGGKTVDALDRQGSSSYTLKQFSENQPGEIIQFRKTQRYDHKEVEKIYKDFIPKVLEEGQVGDLWVYKIEGCDFGPRLYPKDPRPRSYRKFMSTLIPTTLESLARMHIDSLHRPPMVLDHQRAVGLHKCKATLGYLKVHLPSKFSAWVEYVINNVERLWSGDWPFVLRNTSVYPEDVIPNSATGNLKVCLGWGHVKISPFGADAATVFNFLCTPREDKPGWLVSKDYNKYRTQYFNKLRHYHIEGLSHNASPRYKILSAGFTGGKGMAVAEWLGILLDRRNGFGGFDKKKTAIDPKVADVAKRLEFIEWYTTMQVIPLGWSFENTKPMLDKLAESEEYRL